ncbi:unnamed protein product, partial [Phaeothamnion confervicola]
ARLNSAPSSKGGELDDAVQLERFAVKDLKEELRRQGLQTTGRKADLVARLSHSAADDATGRTADVDDAVKRPRRTGEQGGGGEERSTAEAGTAGVGDAAAILNGTSGGRGGGGGSGGGGGDSRVAGGTRNFPRLAPEVRDMQERTHVDLLHRRHVKFVTRDGGDDGNMYVVATRRALRPWDRGTAGP